MPQSTKEKDAPQLQPQVVKQKIVRISPMGLVSLLMQGNKLGVKEGITAGTKYVGGGYDAATNSFFIHLQSDRFEDVKVGERLPDLTIALEDLGSTEPELKEK